MAQEATDRMDELDGAEAIILGCPTYMGNMSAGMKAFREAAVKKPACTALLRVNTRRHPTA